MRLLWQILTMILISILVEVLITNNASKWRKKEYDEKRIGELLQNVQTAQKRDSW